MAFGIEHRLVGATGWTPIAIPAASGGGRIMGYVNGDAIELRARAHAADNTPSAYTSVVIVTIGAGDAAIPAALPNDVISIGALLGGAVVQFSTGPDAATTQVQLYRSTSTTLDRETDITGPPIAVEPSRGYSTPIGDTTRETLLSESAWYAGVGWSVSAGVGSHSPGTSDALRQPVTVTSGKYYRVTFRVSGASAGMITPRFTGGSVRPGTSVGGDGVFSDRIQAVTGNDTFGFVASADWDGSIDQYAVFEETSTCLAAGTHYVWLEPQNDDGVPGPVAGPITVTIR